MIQFQYFPKSQKMTEKLDDVVAVFKSIEGEIESERIREDSNWILEKCRSGLEGIGFAVEKDKTEEGKIAVPVLYGLNGKYEKQFFADGYHRGEQIVIEVEAAAAVANNRFLKDLFEACVMDDVEYCVIAVRNTNLTSKGSKDFDTVARFLDTVYASRKLELPLKGVLILGY